MPNIFLSHNHQDKWFVRRLATDLEAHGATVWLDEAEIKIGDSLIRKIREGIDAAEFVAAVLSLNSVRSRWVQEELELAMTQQIEGKRVTVLPLLIEDCEPPGFLASKAYADFRRDESYASEFVKLARSIGIDAEVTPEMVRVYDLIGNLTSGSARDQLYAVGALGSLGQAAGAAVPVLARILTSQSSDSDSGKVRAAAAAAIGKIGASSPQSTRALIKALKDGDGGVRREAESALARVSTDEGAPTDALRTALADPDLRVRLVALRALGRIGPRAESAVGDVMHVLESDGDVEARVEAALALAGIGAAAHEAAVLLSRTLITAPEPDERGAAARALREVSADTDVAVGALIKALDDDDGRVRSEVALALGSIGPRCAPELPALIAALGISRADARRTAVGVCSQIGTRARAAVPQLRTLLDDDDPGVRHMAIVALGNIDPASSIGELQAFLTGDDDEDAIEAAVALGKAGPAAETAVAALSTALTESSVVDRAEWAADALGKIGSASARAALKTALEHEDERVRECVGKVLAAQERNRPPYERTDDLR